MQQGAIEKIHICLNELQMMRQLIDSKVMPQEPDSQPHWFVADVKPNIEKTIVDALSKKAIPSLR